MIVEGVSFVESEVVKWKREEFIDAHMVFFLDRDEVKRKEILGDIYDRITRKKRPIDDNVKV